jgi:hypothetical protein
MHESWVIGSSSMPRELNAFPCTLWLCAAATMSGRASWIAECSTNAARFTGRLP